MMVSRIKTRNRFLSRAGKLLMRKLRKALDSKLPGTISLPMFHRRLILGLYEEVMHEEK